MSINISEYRKLIGQSIKPWKTRISTSEYREIVEKETRDRIYREYLEQVAFFEWRDKSYRQFPGLELMFHIENEGCRTAAQAARFIAQGGKPGVSDILLPVARRGFHGKWIEMKAPKPYGQKPTFEQLEWIAAMISQGYDAEVCYGCGEAIRAVESYYAPETD